MPLEIDANLGDQLPTIVRNALGQMSPEQQSVFEQEYRRKRKGRLLYVLIAVFFPIQHFLMGKVLLGVVFILSFGGFLLWYLFEWFYTPIKRVSDWNERTATEIMRDMKIMGA